MVAASRHVRRSTHVRVTPATVPSAVVWVSRFFQVLSVLVAATLVFRSVTLALNGGTLTSAVGVTLAAFVALILLSAVRGAHRLITASFRERDVITISTLVLIQGILAAVWVPQHRSPVSLSLLAGTIAAFITATWLYLQTPNLAGRQKIFEAPHFVVFAAAFTVLLVASLALLWMVVR